MSKKKDTLLLDAIAEAKQVKKAAVANAIASLEESFRPHFDNILAQKLRNEMEDSTPGDGHGTEDGGDTDRKAIEETDAYDSSDLGDGDNKVASLDSSDIENPGQEVDTFGDGEVKTGSVKEVEDGVVAPGDGHEKVINQLKEEMPEDMMSSDEDEFDLDVGDDEEDDVVDLGGEYGDDEEEDDLGLGLESILRELEAEIMGHMGEVEEETEFAQDVPADQTTDTTAPTDAPSGEKQVLKLSEEEEEDDTEDDEELDLDEILREMDVEDQGKNPHHYAQVEELQTENVKLKKDLKEYRTVVQFLKTRINEINLLNSKLLFTNKLFKQFDLNSSQKMRVVETFDRANTVREVKLIFSTLAESYAGKTGQATKRVRSITEGMASKPVGSTKSKVKGSASNDTDAIVSDAVAKRFRDLAGIKPLNG